jgi:hypothetical protein
MVEGRKDSLNLEPLSPSDIFPWKRGDVRGAARSVSALNNLAAKKSIPPAIEA